MDKLLSTIIRHQVNHLFLPYIVFKNLCQQALEENLIPDQLTSVFTAGEQLRLDEYIKQFVEATDIRLYNYYGPTETHVVTCYEVSHDDFEQGPLPPIGKPVRNTRVHILDKDWNLSGIGVPGEICVEGVQLSRGYLGNQDEMERRFIQIKDGLLKGVTVYATGDYGRYLEDGNIQFLGRNDDQVKIRGNRVELGEVEYHLDQCNGVRQSAVLIKTDAGNNNYLEGYVVLNENGSTDMAIEHLRRVVPNYMIPGIIVSIDELPLTTNGKVDKLKLKSLDIPRFTGRVEYEAPVTAIEKSLCEIWSDLLGMGSIGRQDNFFELGGNSIVTIQVSSRMRKQGYPLEVEDIFTHQRISEIGRAVAMRMSSSDRTAGEWKDKRFGLVGIQRDYLAFGDLSDTYDNMILRLEKGCKVDLACMIEKLGRRHRSIALRFYREADGRWVQCYGDKDSFYTEELDHMDKTQPQDRTELQERLQQEGRVFGMRYVHLPDGEAELLLTGSRLIFDTRSWGILIEDLKRLLRDPTGELAQGGVADLMFYDLEGYLSRTERPASASSYWDEVGASDPFISHTGPLTGQIKHVYKDVLAEESVMHLTSDSIHTVYRTRINDLLLTALTEVLFSHHDQDRMVLGIESGYREESWLQELGNPGLGNYRCRYRLAVESVDHQGMESQIKQIKEALRKVPMGGAGHSASAKEWDIVFSSDDGADIKALSGSGVVSVEGQRSVVGWDSGSFRRLCVNIAPRANTLEVHWIYASEHYDETSIQEMARQFHTSLDALLKHCRERSALGEEQLTPSDYGLSQDVSVDELDQFLNEKDTDGRCRNDYIEDCYRMTGTQFGILFNALSNEDKGISYAGQSKFYLQDLDEDIVKQAVAWLTERHTILRTSFHMDELSVPVQCVHKQLNVEYVILDISNQSEEKIRDQIQKYASLEIAKGFDFTMPGQFRIFLLKISSDQHCLIWTTHHIISDGWSSTVLKDEFTQVYHAIQSKGQTPRMQIDRYADFVHYLNSLDSVVAKAFWSDYLRGLQSACRIPCMKSQGRRTTSDLYGQMKLFLPSGLYNRLGKYLADHRLTLNTMMHGVWSLILCKLTGHDDIVYGTIVSGRPSDIPDIENKVGLYTNTIVSRSRVNPESSIIQWMKELQKDRQMILRYQQTPLSSIYRMTDFKNDLFNTSLSVQNYPSVRNRPENWNLTYDEPESRLQSNFPLFINVVEQDGQLGINFFYNMSLIAAEDISMIKNMFERVLAELIKSEHEVLNDLPLMSEHSMNFMQQ